MSDNSTPSVRFDGFTNDWEQRKLGELFEKAGSGGTPKSSVAEYYNGDIPFLSISDVSDSNGYIKQTTKMITEAGLQNSAAWIVPRGAISLAMYASVGKVAVLEIDAATSQAFYNMVFTDSSVRDFVYQCLVKASVEDSWRPFISTGTQANLNAEKVRNAVIYKPSDKQEIELINHYCSTVDSLIDLCRRKLDLLMQAKKALMQQIFSQQLRFKADDGSEFPEWGEETVGDLFVFVSSKNTGNTIDNVITNSAEFGLIPQRDFFDKDIAVEGRTENYTIIHKGDFVYNPRKSTTAPYGPFNMYSREEVGIVSPLYTCLTPINSDSSDYLAWYFQTDRWFSYIVKNGAQGGARHDRVGMTNELMKKIPVQVPSLPEQHKIASCLSSADALVDQARVELEQWQEVKKSLLQQLFV